MPAKRILIVDNCRDVTWMYGRLLKRNGYDVMEENDSMHVLEAAREFKPDLMLLDVSMPGMGGLELQRRLPEIDRLIPIVFLSGRASEEDERRALRAGAARFLRKPVGKETLLRAIHAAIEGPENKS